MRLLGFVVGVAATLAMMHAGAACSSFTQQDAPELDGEAGTDGSDGEPLDADGDAADSADAAPPYTVLAQNMADLEGIDANENHAFVVQKSIGAVSAILLAGSTTTTQISTGGPAQSPSAILAFSDNIVWADYGHPGLATFALDGGVAASPIAPNDGLGPSAIARAATGSGFLSATTAASGAGTVSEWASTRPLAQTLNYYSTPPGGNVFDLAVTDTNVYWTESGTATVWTAIRGQPGTYVPFAQVEDGCESIAADGNGVYWTLPTGQVRTKLPNAFGASSVEGADAEQTPFSLAVDASGLYWLTEDGTLRRSRRDGSAAETLASGFPSKFSDRRVQAIALNSTYVVWITTDGRVLRLDK